MQVYRKVKYLDSQSYLVLATQETGRDTEKYVFRLVERGEIVEQMDAIDVYNACPTHKTFEEFIHHWQAEEDVPYISTLNQSYGFKHNKPTKRYSREDGE